MHPVVHLLCDSLSRTVWTSKFPRAGQPGLRPSQDWPSPHPWGSGWSIKSPQHGKRWILAKEYGGKMGWRPVLLQCCQSRDLWPWGAETGSWAMGRGVPGWLRTSLLTSVHRANMLQRLSYEKVWSCGVCHLLWFPCFPKTCYWRWLVWFFHLDYPQGVYFFLQTEVELNTVLQWSRDLVILFCAFLLSDTNSSLLSWYNIIYIYGILNAYKQRDYHTIGYYIINKITLLLIFFSKL